jgi:hypothetical protein
MNNQEINELVRLLNKFDPGFLPHDIFIAIARLIVLPAIEFIPIRLEGNEIQVLLTRRQPDDPAWPNMLHTPGTILRSTDSSLDEASSRLLKDEFGILDPEYVTVTFISYDLDHGTRGTGLTLEHLIEINVEVSVGEYYNVESLPEDFIEGQRAMLERAVIKFKQLKKIGVS